jgi:hypothetical protein
MIFYGTLEFIIVLIKARTKGLYLNIPLHTSFIFRYEIATS